MMPFALLVVFFTVGECKNIDTKIYFENELSVEKPVKEESISHGITKMALELDRAISSIAPSENIIFSPLSIASAMALLLLGAKGHTAIELSEFLGMDQKARINQDYRIKALHEQFGYLLSNLVKGTRDGYEIDTATGVFPQNTYPVKKTYMNQAANIYNSDVMALDYQFRSFDALAVINKWVANKTHNRITHMLSGPPSPETTVILASALFFSGTWKYPFWPDSTKRAPFYVGKPDEVVEVDLMVNAAEIPYFDDEKHDCQMIGLPYIGDEVYMYILLPNNKIETLKSINENELHTMIKSTNETMVIYALPKLTLNNDIDLTNTLQNMGLARTFNPLRADFRDIAEGVFVNQVLHKVEIEVNEVGTKASAATVVSTLKSGANPVVRVDKPFLFFIHHKKTDTIIFWGKILKPTPNYPRSEKNNKNRRFH